MSELLDLNWHVFVTPGGNGIFAGTNSYIAEIGGRQPMTVEEFVTKESRSLRVIEVTDQLRAR